MIVFSTTCYHADGPIANPRLARRLARPNEAARAPSFLYRAGRALVHYRVTGERGEFLNLFFSRP